MCQELFPSLTQKGVHRSLGTHLSSILSLELDEWNDPNVIEHVLHIGNKIANECWLSPNNSLRRVSIIDVRHNPKMLREYIMAKYTGKEFVPTKTSNPSRSLRCSGASRVSAGILRISLSCGVNLTKAVQVEGVARSPPSTFVLFTVSSVCSAVLTTNR